MFVQCEFTERVAFEGYIPALEEGLLISKLRLADSRCGFGGKADDILTSPHTPL